MRKFHTLSVLGMTLILFSGCAYYNTFYNAEQFFKDATKERKKRERTQVVELSPEEQLEEKRRGNLTAAATANKPSATEMQNYQKAIEKASSILEYYPQSRWVDDALIMVGECFFHRGEYTKAKRKFEEIHQLYPNSEFVPLAELLLGKTLLSLGEFDAAEKKLRDITLNDRFPKAIRQSAEYELGSLYFEKGNYEAAAVEYARTAKDSDDRLIRAMSLYRLGECRVQLQQYEEAVPIFRRAVQASPNEDFKSQATYKLGEAQGLLKDHDGAIRTFSLALAKELEVKRIPMIKLQLANNQRAKGDEEAAIKWYRNIIEEHKGTEASARSYFSLAEIEEQTNRNYLKAKENYDLVRGEQSASLLATRAKERSDAIKAMLDLRKSINEILGIATAEDSLATSGAKGEEKEQLDDAPIDLGADGMWMNYTGRDRRPPRSFASEDAAGAIGPVAADGDSLKATVAISDSARQLLLQEEAEKKKNVTLAEKRLELAELLMFSFDRPDSSMRLFLQVVESKPDSAMTARALYSIGYIIYAIKKDTLQADSLFRSLVYLYPGSPHAEGARRILGWPLLSEKVDTAGIVYREAEKAFWDEKDLTRAIRLYDAIAADYPASPYAIKAQYSKGWLYEHEMSAYDKAIETYKVIVEKYPDSAYGKNLKGKLTRHEQAIQAIEARRKAVADSIKMAAEQARAASDSLKRALVPDSTAQAAGKIDSTGMPAAAADSAAADSAAAAEATEQKTLQPDDAKANAAGAVQPGVKDPRDEERPAETPQKPRLREEAEIEKAPDGEVIPAAPQGAERPPGEGAQNAVKKPVRPE